MPRLSKSAISQFVRRDCQRQFRFLLHPETSDYQHERNELDMPDKHPPRPGLEHIAQTGREWEAEKILDLRDALGADSLIAESFTNEDNETRFREISLRDSLDDVTPGMFLVESGFEVGPVFKQAHGLDEIEIDIQPLRPDLIQVLPPGDSQEIALPDGRSKLIEAEDDRLQLRVIDIKQTAEPSASYFIEVAYYTLALAAWLEEHDFDDEFVVRAEVTVWPGSHEGSNIIAVQSEAREESREATTSELLAALEEDYEFGPFHVFCSRLRKLFGEELPEVLDTPWRDLDWHVDHRCIGCEYLGQWVEDPDPEHCYPLAQETGDLSRIAHMSRGASEVLRDRGVDSVDDLAEVESDDEELFSGHHTLQSTRTVVSERASALRDEYATIPDEAGSSAVMPRWADLRVYLTVDFDVGSAITLSLGLKAFWLEPTEYGVQVEDRGLEYWGPETFIIDERDPRIERRELLRFLTRIREITEEAHDLHDETTVQFYIWDEVQYKHLTRIIGRHLPYILRDGGLRDLAWLFPPEDVVENPDQATRNSPITLLSNVVRSVLAVPVPHVYSLLNIAREYHREDLDEDFTEFSVHPLFEDDFSSQIPSERAHGIWGRVEDPIPWHQQITVLDNTVKTRLRAIEEVTRRLEGDLRQTLGNTAPRIDLGPPDREPGVGWDGQLWLAFARLDAALNEREIDEIRARPPHEREARFKSAILERELEGGEAFEAREQLGLEDGDDIRIYKMRPQSCEVSTRRGDFLRCLAPECDTSVLDNTLHWYLSDNDLFREVSVNRDDNRLYGMNLEDALQVTVEEIDRGSELIAVRPDGPWIWEDSLAELEESSIFDFSRNVSLEEMHGEYLLDKLRTTLHDIGNPDIQRDDPLVRRAVGMEFRRRGHSTAHTPVADLIWNSEELANEIVPREIESAKEFVTECGLSLNDSQWAAWKQALTHRMRLIWGPPGTGKTRTLHAITMGAIHDAIAREENGRILVTAPTYNALDNVLSKVYTLVSNELHSEDVKLYRLRGRHSDPPENHLAEIDTENNWYNPSDRLEEMRTRLEENSGVTVVGGAPQQIFKIAGRRNSDVGQEELFDLILVDEASQMDVAHSILPYATMADGASVIVAGDPKQLAPIHKADPPLDLDSMVGATYEFFRDERYHGVSECSLTKNYRSNDSIVGFQRSSEYPPELESHSPDMRIDLIEPLGEEPPKNWPDELPFGEFLNALLDPEKSCICVTYDGGLDSQWNQFESNIVLSVVSALRDRLGNQLLNEFDGETGERITVPEEPYSTEEFWNEGVGIVTPHRAQQALLIDQLQRKVGEQGESELIRDAVDTVERFQGQERDVIIASYAVSDPDMIGDEEEFLLGLHRFNVMQSRARAKVIVILSEELVRHLSNELDVLKESDLLKNYARIYCDEQELHTISTEHLDREIAVRYHSDETSSR